MAVSINISNITYKGAQINISGLQYYALNYSFRYRLENQWYNGSNDEWHEWSLNGSGNSYSYSYQMTGDEAFLTPHTNYTCKVYGLYGGIEYLLGTVYFTTSDVSRPSATQYLPAYIPQVLDQWVWDGNDWIGEANCCVACALASVLSILEYREKGTANHQYSISYIYGNRNLQGDAPPTSSGTSTTELDGMFPDATLDQLKTDGTPVWTKIPENKDFIYPDNRFYEDDWEAPFGTGGIGAQTVFHNARYNNTQIYAYLQCLNQRQNIHFYDSQAVANAIQNNGYYLFNFDIPNSFYGVGSSGIVPEPDSTTSYGGHTTVLIGWKTINGIKYWIGLNSWGDWFWGDNGLFYLPMDWGASVAHVNNNANWLWPWMGYTASAKTVVPNTANVKVWNGTSWVMCTTKAWNGSTWISVPVKVFR